MYGKCLIFFALLIAATSAAPSGVIASYAIAPYATSYSSHVVNHAVASPVVAAAPAPLVAAPAPFVHAAAPLVHAASPLVHAAAPLVHAAAPAPYTYFV